MSKSIDKYKIIKELGHGMIGTTYLVKLQNKYYALKIEKVVEDAIDKNKNKIDIIHNTKYPEWREIEFSKKFGNKYPEQFMELINYDVIENCDHIQKYTSQSIELMPESVRKIINEKINSTYCIRKVYSLVDCDLSKIINNLNKKELYSFIIQTLHIILLLNTNGYNHNDLHGQNIGVIKTKKKYINIIGIRVPTCGYNFVALDFGLMTKNTWNLTEYEKNYKCKDIIRTITKTIKYSNNFEFRDFRKNKLFVFKDLNIEITNSIKNNPFWEDLNQYVYNNDNDDKLFLFQIIYSEIFQKILLKKNFKKVNPVIYKIDLIDIIYFIKNKHDLKKIIKYFILQINDK